MKYIVAVSGGIDSRVMLDVLSQGSDELVVAHVNHGIRDDSAQDEALVRELARRSGYIYESTRLQLGHGASEELARDKRYEWLETMRVKHGADAIATAHHQDDVIETIILNLMRGTGWRGLCSLRQTETRHRPLLGWDKASVVAYALEHDLAWREDSTNEDMRYTRNYIRQGIVPRLSGKQRREYVQLYEAQCQLRVQIEHEISTTLASYISEKGLLRYPLIMLADVVALELLRTWLPIPLEPKRLRELLLFAKTARPGAKWSLSDTQFVMAETRQLIV